MKNLTDKSYWDSTYNNRRLQPPLNFDGFTNRANRLILDTMLSIDMRNKRILEVGAGDSVWLPYLARRFPTSHCVGIDYSEGGCALLTERARAAGVDLEVIQEDLFVENSKLHDAFDVVISFGVIEHFDDLGQVLTAKKRYLKRGGFVFAIIPNMAGILGTLARRWNREVYDKHNPHAWNSFSLGHQQAGLEVLSGGYLGSVSFGVLSACFPERRGLSWQISKVLAAISLATWWAEDRFGNPPSSRTFSPYIYATVDMPHDEQHCPCGNH
jgi:2-polyprenyl-3-methyl-5-hydroxy-6-metoxy-1,4-benzoquinol methylase